MHFWISDSGGLWIGLYDSIWKIKFLRSSEIRPWQILFVFSWVSQNKSWLPIDNGWKQGSVGEALLNGRMCVPNES